MKNFVSSRGDELRSKMEAAGLSAEEASVAERGIGPWKTCYYSKKKLKSNQQNPTHNRVGFSAVPKIH